MPGPVVHAYVDKLLFGRSYWRIHREMDRPYKYLGRYHRILFHDPLLAYAIARRQYPNDPNAIAAAQCHIAVDNLCSRNQKLKRALERLARLDRKKTKSAKASSGFSQAVAADTLLDCLGTLTSLPISPIISSVNHVFAELWRKTLRKRLNRDNVGEE